MVAVPDGSFVARKIGYLTPVNVVDGVPLCPCCQEPCVKRGDGWMCGLGAAVLDGLAAEMAAVDVRVLDAGPFLVDDGGWSYLDIAVRDARIAEARGGAG